MESPATTPPLRTAADATVRRMRELLEEVIDNSVDASTYPDGPCLDRELRNRIKAELANDGGEPHAPKY